MLHWLWQQTVSNQQYIWISNFSNLTVFLLLGSAIGLYKHHNCREPRCPRIGHHPVQGTTFKTCRPHTKIEVHDRLAAQHAQKHPEQHALLNRKEHHDDNSHHDVAHRT